MTQHERIHHEVTIDPSTCTEGGENVFPCQVEGCGEQIHLAYDGQSFSLFRQEERDNPEYGTVGITLIEKG